MPRRISIVFDTCTILNLVNGEALPVITTLPFKFFIGPIVYSECTRQTCPELDVEISSGRIVQLSPNLISVSTFSELANKFNLGDGETECIALGKALALKVCSDDKLARESAIVEIGEKQVIGSIGLLKLAVENSILSCKDAFNKYQQMVSSGAFFPKLDSDYFCK